jgi:hypothetical protein
MRKAGSISLVLYFCMLVLCVPLFSGCVVVAENQVNPYGTVDQVDYVTTLPDFYVDVNVPAPPPPQLPFSEPPEMVVVPSGQTSVYMVPNTTGVYFYDGLWYRNYNGYWYNSSSYNDGWSPIRVNLVPTVIVAIPPEYPRYLPPTYPRVGYVQVNANWRAWRNDPTYWNRHEWYRHEARPEIKRERFEKIRVVREKVVREQHEKRTIDTNRNGRNRDENKNLRDNKQIDHRPGDKKLEERQPGDRQSAKKQLEEQKPGAQKPEKKKQDVRQPGDRQPAKKQPEEQKPGAQKPEKKKQDVRQPGDRQPAKKQLEEQKSGEKDPAKKKQEDH